MDLFHSSHSLSLIVTLRFNCVATNQMRHQTTRRSNTQFFRAFWHEAEIDCFLFTVFAVTPCFPLHLFHCEKSRKMREILNKVWIKTSYCTWAQQFSEPHWSKLSNGKLVEHSVTDTFYVCYVYQHGLVTDSTAFCANGMLKVTWRFRLNPEMINMDLIFRKY